tara:strand:+ start:2579 stop:2929 length:351 start_codon:yes stop_codon:yes gene_type:complete
MDKKPPKTQAMSPAASKTKKASSAKSSAPRPDGPNAGIKKRPRVTGRPFIKMEDEILAEKITKMKQQYDVANSRLIILADRISKHEHESKCREHDTKLSEDLIVENMEEEGDAETE